jgi:hypothetical protein
VSVIIRFIDPSDLLDQPSEKTSPSADLNALPPRQDSIDTSEERLWKFAVLSVSPKLAIIEIVFLALVLALAIALIVGCFAELSYLLEADSVGHLAAKVIGKTA